MRTRAPCTSTPESRVSGARGRRTRRCRARRVGLLDRLDRAQPLLVGDHQLARCDLALERRADEVECARSRRRRPGRRRAGRATSGRNPNASRKANSLPSASPTTVAAPSRRAIVRRRPRRAAARRRRSARRSPRSRSSSRVACGPLPQRVGVDEVAVVAERDRAHAAVVQQRLGVLPGVPARRRVARVPDREVAVQPREAALVEDLWHESEIAQGGQPPVLADRDPGRLLARGAATRRGRSS